MARRNENPKSVVSHPLPTPRDSSDQGRMDSKGSTPADGTEQEKVSAVAIPEKRGVREPDMNFQAPTSVDRNRGATNPPRRGG
jgi:hypothetical protein